MGSQTFDWQTKNKQREWDLLQASFLNMKNKVMDLPNCDRCQDMSVLRQRWTKSQSIEWGHTSSPRRPVKCRKTLVIVKNIDYIYRQYNFIDLLLKSFYPGTIIAWMWMETKYKNSSKVTLSNVY